MNDLTRLLESVERGDAGAAEQLLPLVYRDLRQLAAQRMAGEKPGQTLDATALVHEAYLRVVGDATAQAAWNGRGHFFAAAAEAMRRIMIDRARRKASAKGGGRRQRVELGDLAVAAPDSGPVVDILALDEALRQLAEIDPEKARLVTLRYFAGLSLEDAAQVLGISKATAKRHWVFARSWLYGKLHGE